MSDRSELLVVGGGPAAFATIATHTLKHAAWGDGFDDVRLHERLDGGLTAWYDRDNRLVGVLTYEVDDERGREPIAAGAEW